MSVYLSLRFKKNHEERKRNNTLYGIWYIFKNLSIKIITLQVYKFRFYALIGQKRLLNVELQRLIHL